MPSAAAVAQVRIRSSVQVQGSGTGASSVTCSRKRPIVALLEDRQQDVTDVVELDHDSDSTSDSCDKPRRKRQRLDHLSQEEKVMRRKLKNRVAAQYARDRKKVLVDEMAITISDLRRDKQQLSHDNDRLKNENKELFKEIERLKEALTLAGGRMSDQVTEKTTESAALTNDRQPRDQVFPKIRSNSFLAGNQQSAECSSNFFSCLMLTMASLTIANSQMKSSSTPTTTSLSHSTKAVDRFTKCSVKSLNVDSNKSAGDGDRRDDHRWGSQQQSWNPAKIHTSYVV